jgi:hypothetical protein
LYDTAARRRLLSLLAQKKVAKETAPKFVAILIVEYHIDDTYGDPALLDQARQAAQLTHRYRAF